MKFFLCINLTILLLLSSFIKLKGQITIEPGVEFTVMSGEVLTAEGDFTNAGTLTGKGTINIAGSYENTGTLRVLIGPDQNTHTTIGVIGTFTPGGNFIVINDSYLPTNNDQATIVTSGNGISTNFSNSENNSWYANYNLPTSGEFIITHLNALPIKLNFFKGKISKNKIILDWQTSSEINNQGFEIQRSHDGETWLNIGFKRGIGTTIEQHAYQFLDLSPEPEINYYRLKQIDFNGNFEFSEIISLNFQKQKSIQIYPNPTNGVIEIEGSSEGIIKVYSSIGILIKEQILSKKSILDLTSFPKGIYSISFFYNNQITTKQVVKY